jgi:endonuclease III
VKSASEVVNRFAEFNGIGQKISTMAVNILMKNFKIPFEDKRGIDVSTDSQVMKVMTKLGFIDNDKQREKAIKVARQMNPDYPGVIDLTLWQIGRDYCHGSNPDCKNCIVKYYCINKK